MEGKARLWVVVTLSAIVALTGLVVSAAPAAATDSPTTNTQLLSQRTLPPLAALSYSSGSSTSPSQSGAPSANFYTNCTVSATGLKNQYLAGGNPGMVGVGETYCNSNVIGEQVCVALMQFWNDENDWHTYPTVCSGEVPSNEPISQTAQQECTNGTPSRYWAVKVTGYAYTQTGQYSATIVYPTDSSGGPEKTKMFPCNA